MNRQNKRSSQNPSASSARRGSRAQLANTGMQSVSLGAARVAPLARTSQNFGSRIAQDSYLLEREEYVGPIYGSVAFAVTSYQDNPGLPAFYNRTYQISASYEEYLDESKTFIYRTATNPSVALGNVVMGYDFDTLDAAPTNMVEALQVKDFVQASPWHDNVSLDLKPADLRRKGFLYTRTGAISGADYKTYDRGLFYVATQGQSDATLIGHLWVRRRVRLTLFQGPPSVGATVTSGGTVSKTAIFGSAATSVGISPVTATGSVLTFNQPGEFLIHLQRVGTGVVAMSTVPAISTGSSLTNLVEAFNGATTAGSYLSKVKVVEGATLTYNASTDTSVTSSVLYVAAFEYSQS